jgi:hypothetical protein
MLPIIVFIPLALIALAAIVARAKSGLRARAAAEPGEKVIAEIKGAQWQALTHETAR